MAAAGCEIWDVEYVREAGEWYLRLYLGKEGGVDIQDCEAVSRVVSDLLDEADPIEGSYTFEVSSAGAERVLKRPGDFEKFLGSPVLVKLYKARDGRKEFPGYLKSYDNGDTTTPRRKGPDLPQGGGGAVPPADRVLRDRRSNVNGFH